MIRHVSETIRSLKWQGHLTKIFNNNKVIFYQGNLEFLINNQLVFGGLIFINIEFVQHYASRYKHSRNIFINGTFYILPWITDMEQLITVHTLLDNNVIN